jgi:protein-disulfide isomerase/uncharacterized membrane protein
VGWPKRILIVLAFVVSMTGACLSVQLLSQHLSSLGISAVPFLHASCGGEGGSCDKVLASRWAVFPPKPKVAAGSLHEGPGKAADRSGQPLRMPVSLFGLCYFTFLAAWFVGVGCPNYPGRRWQLVPLAAVLLGNACSAFFMYIMASVVKAWCPYCLATHAVNFLLLIIVLATCPRRVKRIVSPASGTAPVPAGACPTVVAYPSRRLALVTMSLAISLWLVGTMTVVATAVGIQTVMLTKTVAEVAKCPDALLAVYSSQEPQDVHIRPDDPGRGGPVGSPVTLVVFSGIVCPQCVEFDAFVDEKVEPLFKGRLRVICKHFPLSDECNPAVGSARMAQACNAADAVEAARLQGGDKLFWRMVHELRAHMQDLGLLNYADEATRLGLDSNRLVADMRGPVVRRRIAEDAELGSKLGVKSTPTAYLNGRLVPPIARDNLGFWELVAGRMAGVTSASAPATATLPSGVVAGHEDGSPAGKPSGR